jgi:catechol 2,3-dioxygenase-like lactoylglutathione lyase family enzyme
MITAAHAIIYSDDAEATRAFLRDVLELRCDRD